MKTVHSPDHPSSGDYLFDGVDTAAQFLLESTTFGLIGGILGASLGILFVVAVSATQLWTPVLDPAAPFLAILIGAAIGLIAGTYPALRAARLESAAAVRAGP